MQLKFSEMNHTEAKALRAALFIDYDNLCSAIQDRFTSADPSALTLELIDALCRELTTAGMQPAFGVAYASFEPGGDSQQAQTALFLNGIEPRFMPSGVAGNIIDLQLCVDAVTLLHTGPAVDAFVLVTGNRPPIPLLQHLRRYGRQVVLVTFADLLSAEHMHFAQQARLMDAGILLGNPTQHLLQADASKPNGARPGLRFNPVEPLSDDVSLDTLDLIERYFGQYDEIYLTPLLRKLSDEMEDVPDYDPKLAIGCLEEAGAARLEKRKGSPHPYTVLILNNDHPDVIAARQAFLDDSETYVDQP